jgi:hypothetical protein
MKRTETELQRAHDLLIMGLVEDLLPTNRAPGNMCFTAHEAMGAANILCWILGHDHNASFEEQYAELQKRIKDRGYEIVDMGRTIDPTKEPEPFKIDGPGYRQGHSHRKRETH